MTLDLSLMQLLVAEWLVRSVAVSGLALIGLWILVSGTSTGRCRFLLGTMVLLLGDAIFANVLPDRDLIAMDDGRW